MTLIERYRKDEMKGMGKKGREKGMGGTEREKRHPSSSRSLL